MFSIDELFQPESLNEAAELLDQYPDITILGGCGFLKLGNRRIARAMDLTNCGVRQIREDAKAIEIGAMATLRQVETDPALRILFNGALPRAAGSIMGVQFRNCATMGASVYSKYGFSDLIPVLLTLNTEVELLRGGRLRLIDFMERPIARDVLTRIFIAKDGRQVSYQNMRNATADFPILNCSVSQLGSDWQVVVGARPARAQLAMGGSKMLSDMSPNQIDIEKVAATVSGEVAFGNNNKASADYRRSLARVLVKRAIEEVLACK